MGETGTMPRTLSYGNPTSIAQNPQSFITLIQQRLTEGNLSLFLGAGLSKPFGLPTWGELVNKLLIAKQMAPLDLSRNPPVRAITDAAARVEREFGGNISDFLQLVHDSLYPPFTPDSDYREMFGQESLAAVASLLMGSKFGRASQVYTTNYDDCLERYLAFHGFRAQSILRPNATHVDSDITIYHPHGYLPRGKRDFFSDHLVLSTTSYHLYQGEGYHGPWPSLVFQSLKSTFPLFIGSSGDDPIFEFYFVNLVPPMGPAQIDRSILGGIILKDNTANASEKEQLIQKFTDRRVVPFFIRDYQELPKVLFAILRVRNA